MQKQQYRIVGVAGYGRAGKDTFVKGLRRAGFERMAFADQLKTDLYDFVLSNYNIDLNNLSEEEKVIVRPLLVAHGAGKRMQDKDHWLNIVANKFETTNIAVSDCRYLNELKRIVSNGGAWAYIERPGVYPANEEERRSFQEITDAVINQKLAPPIVVPNTGKITDLVNKGELFGSHMMTMRQLDLRELQNIMNGDTSNEIDKLADLVYNSANTIETSLAGLN